jgi:amino acid adenylation domain-containing protein
MRCSEDGSAAAQQFWSDYFTGIAAPRSLPGYLGGAVAGEAATAETLLSSADSDLVRRAASAAGLTSDDLVTAAWALLRARYGGVSDVVLAVTASDTASSNTVPLRVRVADDATVREFVTAVRDATRQVMRHQPASANTPLTDTQVMFGRPPTGLPPSYLLTLCAFDEPELHLSLVWDRSRFADCAGARMLSQLRDTLIEMATAPAAPLAGLDLGRAAEADVIARWNVTSAPYAADATICELFAAQVARDPDAIALAFGGGSMTYAELDRRSSLLAWLLRKRGVTEDTPVGVAMARGAGLIVTLLAVLKAGGAYLPVETGSPASRVAAMITATGTRLVLATPETAAALPTLAGVDIVDSDLAADDDADSDITPPPAACHPLSLAYISFTSGSTGVPKGVEVPHRAVIRLISDPMFASLGPGERILHMAPVAFDASTLEIWGALLTGATVVIAPPGPLGLPDIARLLRDSGVTIAWLTAGLFHQLAEADPTSLADVGVLLAGGDALNPDTVRAVLTVRRGKPLVNGYGPTENTTFTACHVMTDPADVGLTVPIGRPIQHTTAHILDSSGRPAPIGVTGELYAGGDGLARGYAGNAAATARAFVPDPSGSGARLYRTGDLARWRADGILEFVGRADNQVKIRGFRVEPGEVEAVLRAYPGVRESVVVPAGDGAWRHLIGYVTPADGADPRSLRPGLLRDFVAARLPEYLVPTAFQALDRFPLNANGKVDKAALPAPEREFRGPVTMPQGPTEERLADIWRRLLPADSDVGREDSFFALGGNSLSAARLMFRIREAFGVELGMAMFYKAPTLAASAAAIDAVRRAGGPASIGRRDRTSYRVADNQASALYQREG